MRLTLTEESKKLLSLMPERAKQGMVKGLLIGMYEAERTAKIKHLSGRTSRALEVRSGRLRGSIRHRVYWRGNTLVGRLGTNVIYGRIHEKGGTIVPVNRKWLTIPTKHAKTPVGVVRGRAGSFANTFLLKPSKEKPNRPMMIMQRKGKNDVVPLFILKKRVQIPKRPFLRPSIDDNMGLIKNSIAKMIKEAIVT